MDTYIFPCVFTYREDKIAIYFPDLDGVISSGENEQDAFRNAHEALLLHLFGMEEDGDHIPEPSTVKGLQLEENQCAVLIEVYMPPFRLQQENKYVKKTLTIPEWLNILGEKNNVNFSQLLQKALKQHLNMA